MQRVTRAFIRELGRVSDGAMGKPEVGVMLGIVRGFDQLLWISLYIPQTCDPVNPLWRKQLANRRHYSPHV